MILKTFEQTSDVALKNASLLYFTINTREQLTIFVAVLRAFAIQHRIPWAPVFDDLEDFKSRLPQSVVFTKFLIDFNNDLGNDMIGVTISLYGTQTFMNHQLGLLHDIIERLAPEVISLRYLEHFIPLTPDFRDYVQRLHLQRLTSSI